MAGQPAPPLIVEAFGVNAGAPYIQTPIPLTTATPGRASFDQGFPAVTMTEIFAGGTPPFGQDMNGILNMVTAHLAAANAGQPYLFDSSLSTAMGGYAAGCMVGMADGTGLWINTSSGNTTDPDGGSATGWMPLYSYGFAAITGLTGGVRTLTPAEYRRRVIVLSGALTGNLQVVFPTGAPVGQESWLIVNTCSGAFTVTAKTAAGTGVAIPAGGYSAPTEVYGDGTNIYPTVAPITIPTDVAPSPNTIALRNNVGYLFATFFNSNNGVEAFTVNNVYADSGDGYHRKISLENFALQLFNNATLTGVPTAPTAVAGTSNNQIATTQFTTGTFSPGANGSLKLPSGLLLQWGQINFTGSGADFMFGTLTFPTPFTSGPYIVVGNGTTRANGGALNGSGNIDVCAFDSYTANNCRWRADTNSGNALTGSHSLRWFAVGV